MFELSHQVGFFNYQALVWILYSKLDLNRLPSFGKDVAKFIMQLVVDLSLCLGIKPDTSLCGVTSQVKFP